MNQPPGRPPQGPPPGGPPPGGPPPGGQPYGPPPSSRLRPPWRDAPSGEHAPVVLWAVVGFLLPWMVLVLGIALGILGYPTALVVCVAVTLLIDVAGFVVAMVANRLQVRGAAYGSFAGCLTHMICAAVAAVVFFGWCVATLNGSY